MWQAKIEIVERILGRTVQQRDPEQEPISLLAGQSCSATVAPQPVPKIGVWPRLRAATERRTWLLPATVTALVLVMLQYGTFRLRSSSNRVPVGHEQLMPLLHVEQIGQQLHITWNRKAPAVAEARRGVLLIADGAYRKELHLDVTQLRSGSVAYLPLTREVNFRLDLEWNRATVTESLIAVMPQRAEALQVDPQLNPPRVSTDPVSTQTQADAVTQPVRRPAKQRPTTTRPFFDDGL